MDDWENYFRISRMCVSQKNSMRKFGDLNLTMCSLERSVSNDAVRHTEPCGPMSGRISQTNQNPNKSGPHGAHLGPNVGPI